MRLLWRGARAHPVVRGAGPAGSSPTPCSQKLLWAAGASAFGGRGRQELATGRWKSLSLAKGCADGKSAPFGRQSLWVGGGEGAPRGEGALDRSLVTQVAQNGQGGGPAHGMPAPGVPAFAESTCQFGLCQALLRAASFWQVPLPQARAKGQWGRWPEWPQASAEQHRGHPTVAVTDGLQLQGCSLAGFGQAASYTGHQLERRCDYGSSFTLSPAGLLEAGR